MLIKYRFSINGRLVSPIYKDDLSKDYALEPQQKFYRAELSGVLKFIKEDFDWIMAQSFQTEFIVLVEKSNDGGATWSDYFKGSFFKADCQIDLDSKKIEVKLSIKDQYNLVLAGLEKEYDMLKFAPARTELTIDKRPLIQLYIPGDSVLSCFLSGMSWEQDVNQPVESDTDLVNLYSFALASTFQKCIITGDNAPNINGEYLGEFNFHPATPNQEWTGANDTYFLRYVIIGEWDTGYPYRFDIIRSSDSTRMFSSSNLWTNNIYPLGNEITLYANPGTGASGSATLYCFRVPVYMRYLLDVENIQGLNTYVIPDNDIVENNYNYKRVIGYAIDCVTISTRVSDTPTIYGRNDKGKYFMEPYSFYNIKHYPIARSTWGESSIWFAFETFDWLMEQDGRKSYQMRDAIMVSDAIKVLLNEIDPGISHEGTSEYSQFLYGEINPITYNSFKIMITPKSNILSSGYDQPAQKAPITLSALLGMLRDTMKVYWYIEDNKFKLEHISWFRNGGAYMGDPSISFDLTTLVHNKNKKPWGFVSSKYSYDKIDLPERYEFGWMDEVTEGFEGFPIEIKSKYVQRGKIENINISTFTSDVDYMLLNPSVISKDGFVVFAAVWSMENNRYQLPYIERTIDRAELRLQNGFLSFIYLHPNFWTYDLPGKDVWINGEQYTLIMGIDRKLKQKISFPSLDDPNPFQLIKTYLGDGQIEKLSINLQSRMNDIELKYDTE